MPKDDEVFFAAPWGRGVWAITLFVLAIFAALIVFLHVMAMRQGLRQSELRAAEALVIALAALLVPGTLVFAPKRYAVGPSGIRVARLWSDVRIPWGDVASVRVVSPRWVIRTFGNGGLFGYVGRFRGSDIGRFRAYCTRMRRLVLIVRNGRESIAISPEPLDEFLKMAEQYTGQPANPAPSTR